MFKQKEPSRRSKELGTNQGRAKAAASLAPILWADQLPLERDSLLTLVPELRHEQLATAGQLHPAQVCAGDGSGEAVDNQQLM
jgi:hypothetical protein